jgi:hypothetical protein
VGKIISGAGKKIREKKGSVEFCCRGSRYKDLSFRDLFFFLSGLD